MYAQHAQTCLRWVIPFEHTLPSSFFSKTFFPSVLNANSAPRTSWENSFFSFHFRLLFSHVGKHFIRFRPSHGFLRGSLTAIFILLFWQPTASALCQTYVHTSAFNPSRMGLFTPLPLFCDFLKSFCSLFSFFFFFLFLLPCFSWGKNTRK